MQTIRRTMVAMVMAAWLVFAGCDREALQVSVEELDFGETETRLEFELYNANPNRDEISVSLVASDPWIEIEPGEAVSVAPEEDDDGELVYDATTITVTLDRTALADDPVEGFIEITGKRLKKERIPVFAKPPYEAIALSKDALVMGGDENHLEVTVTNVNKKAGRVDVYATADQPWIDINRRALALDGRNASATVVVGVKRATLTGGYHEGRVLFEAAGYVSKKLDVIVFQPYQAIVTSNQLLDFERNERPLLMEAWNGNKEFESLEITATPSHRWIEVLPTSVTSAAPTTVIDPVLEQPVTTYDKRQLLVVINRRRLEAGNHEGYILFEADSPLVASRSVTVRVVQDDDPPDRSGELYIENPKALYSHPYLVDFAFGLTDANGDGFVAEPAQLTVGAFENGENVTRLVQPVLHRGAARQLRAEIVMDYSIGMRLNPAAMDDMEYAATELFLPTLPEEALVGATLYYRDDLDATRIAPFTLDHDHVAAQIAAIQSDMIGSFSSGSRMLDTVHRAVRRFDRENVIDEERFILLLAGSGDTSSIETVERVIQVAQQRHVKIHVVGFLNDSEGAAMMLDLAASTGGVYLPVGAAEELPRIIGLIVDGLDANYLLRWATLKRKDISVAPGFSVAFTSYPAIHTADEPFNPQQIAGDVLEGRLRVATSQSGDNASALLRAEYMPRYITRLRLIILASLPFTVTPVPVGNSGLVEHWHMVRQDREDGVVIIDLSSPDGTELPFATFGGLLRFDFEGVPPVEEPLFTQLEVDNDIEEYSGDQFFTIVM